VLNTWYTYDPDFLNNLYKFKKKKFKELCIKLHEFNVPFSFMFSYLNNDAAFLSLCIPLKVPSHYEEASIQWADEFANNASMEMTHPFFDSPLIPLILSSAPSCSPFVFTLLFNPSLSISLWFHLRLL
jgi:hypothetical protein